MADPNDLTAFLNEAWQHLRRGAADSRSPARFPTLATVGLDGTPQARTVALRKAHQEDAILVFHTDIVTPKVAELKANPTAAFHVWLPKSNLQIRLNTTVEILTGAVVDADWNSVPKEARVSYGTAPNPGEPIGHVFEYDKPALQDRFAVLHCHVTHIDLVHLGTPHRRAAFKRDDRWSGTWLAP